MHHRLVATLAGALLLTAAPAQSYESCADAVADAFSLQPGTDALAIPGVASDFEIAAGGTLVRRGDGTARISALLRRKTAIDRQFLLVLELGGEVLPGQVNHPPAGALPPGLSAAAYVPTGPVDPAAWIFYTSCTGALTGLGAYGGGRIDLASAAPVQLGDGASNRHIGRGVLGQLAMQVSSQPLFTTFVTTGDALLTLQLAPSSTDCASHADRDDALSQGAARYALDLPGVGRDYVFVPTGEWIEAGGTATLRGTVLRELDFADRWELTLQCSLRVDPGDASHPPAAGAAIQLLPQAYVGGGGLIDPATFRFYQGVSGQLVGGGDNGGAVITLQGSRPLQVGVGANNANGNFGIYGEFTGVVVAQGTTRTFAITGRGSVRANAMLDCVLPYPNQTPGLIMTADNVTGAPAMLTGQNLAWTEQLGFDGQLLTLNDREWRGGYLRVIDSTQVEVYPPQGYTPGNYTTRVFTRSGAGGFRQLALNVPAASVIRTAPDRVAGEPMDWVMSHGNLGQSMAFLTVSGSNLPSVLPEVSLGIGAGFSQLLTAGPYFTDPITGAATVHVPALPASIGAMRFYCQAVMIPLANTGVRPLPVSDVWFTDFR